MAWPTREAGDDGKYHSACCEAGQRTPAGHKLDVAPTQRSGWNSFAVQLDRHRKACCVVENTSGVSRRNCLPFFFRLRQFAGGGCGGATRLQRVSAAPFPARVALFAKQGMEP